MAPGHKGHLLRMIRAIVASLLHCLDTQASAAGLVHLDDAVDAAILVAQRREAASKVYIVAEPRAYSSHEIYEIVLRSPGGRRPRPGYPALSFVIAAPRDVGSRPNRTNR